MTGRAKTWKSAAILLVLGGALVWIGGRSAAPAVEIGSALQAISAGGDDGAARHTEQVSYDDEDLELVAGYVVADAQLPPSAPPAHQALWTIAEDVLPVTELARIRQLNVVTDGPNGTLGMVHRSGLAADQWVLSLDEAEKPAVLGETLVHELAHMLTLGRGDLDARTDDCEGVRVPIGCAIAGSTLAAWADAFWPDPAGTARYDRDRFVSEYAASAVHEDLAETFLAYVLDEDPRSPIIAEKFAFFDGHPDLALVAQQARINLALA
jgi:hypothetical protein